MVKNVWGGRCMYCGRLLPPDQCVCQKCYKKNKEW